ncbi:MAG: NAD(P)-dependent oxidoreductase [Beijerinckiaceae bacterium]|nr:MAG: NAD(P)-dependent oxidoreductase [Beijerinckiaceae bacterium]
MNVGFLGLGAMGSGMALNLLKAGHKVIAWNRSPEKAQALVAEGATAAQTPQEAFQADAIITMLADDDTIASVVLAGDLLETAKADAVHIVMATISVGFSKELERLHAARGLAYVAAPVMGRPDVATGGDLNILVAGKPEHIQKVQPLLDAMGKATWPVGDAPHKANVVKLGMNFLLASAIESMSEAIALARRNDVPAETVVEVLTNTLFAAPAYKVYGSVILDGTFKPGFKLPLGLKDIRLVLAAGEQSGAPMPFASLLRDNFIDALAHGDGDKDWAAISKVALRRAGLT